MCLVRVKETEEHVVPYRVVDRHNSRRRTSHQSQRRYSRTEIVHQDSPRPSASYVAVPTPKPLPIPAPQPVPVFVQPPPAPIPAPAPPPPPASHHGTAHYVEVSPRSSISSRSSSPPRSEYVYREREFRRERETGPQYDHYRYVEPQRSESEVGYARSRSRQRSMSRGGYEDPRGSFREERTRIVIEDERGGGAGGRRRDYR